MRSHVRGRQLVNVGEPWSCCASSVLTVWVCMTMTQDVVKEEQNVLWMYKV